jgi:hypothetical protein
MVVVVGGFVLEATADRFAIETLHRNRTLYKHTIHTYGASSIAKHTLGEEAGLAPVPEGLWEEERGGAGRG